MQDTADPEGGTGTADLENVWGRVTERLRRDIGDSAWRNWIKPLRVSRLQDGTLTLEPVVGGFRRMDCNTDGSGDIGDAIAALSILFTGGTMLCEDACDVNDDGEFNIADAIAALSILFSGAAPPPPPIGDCGPDPTPDALECDTYNSC